MSDWLSAPVTLNDVVWLAVWSGVTTGATISLALVLFVITFRGGRS